MISEIFYQFNQGESHVFSNQSTTGICIYFFNDKIIDSCLIKKELVSQLVLNWLGV